MFQDKNKLFKTDFIMKFPDDSAWLCMEKLKKHRFEIKNLIIEQKLQNKTQQILKTTSLYKPGQN